MEAFRTLFHLPDERLVAYCSCSIWQNLLQRGGLYISVNYLCFFSSPSSLATTPRKNSPASSSITPIRLAIPFSEVSMISKTSSKPELGIIPSSILIPNAIRINTNNEEVLLFVEFKLI